MTAPSTSSPGSLSSRSHAPRLGHREHPRAHVARAHVRLDERARTTPTVVVHAVNLDFPALVDERLNKHLDAHNPARSSHPPPAIHLSLTRPEHLASHTRVAQLFGIGSVLEEGLKPDHPPRRPARPAQIPISAHRKKGPTVPPFPSLASRRPYIRSRSIVSRQPDLATPRREQPRRPSRCWSVAISEALRQFAVHLSLTRPDHPYKGQGAAPNSRPGTPRERCQPSPVSLPRTVFSHRVRPEHTAGIRTVGGRGYQSTARDDNRRPARSNGSDGGHRWGGRV